MRKKRILQFVIIVFSVLLSVYMKYSGADDRNSNILTRKGYREGDYEVSLKAQTDNREESMTISVSNLEYTRDELDRMAQEVIDELPKTILGGNEDMNSVYEDLSLPSSLGGYPFTLRWKSSDEDLIDHNGKLLCKKDCPEVHEVQMNLSLIYEDYIKTSSIPLKIIPSPLSEEDKFFIRLLRRIQETDIKTQSSLYMILPTVFEGKSITWIQKEDSSYLYIIPAGVILSILISFAYERDENEKKRRRQERLDMEYPKFVEKMKLYYESGLNTKKALLEIRNQMKDAGGSKSELYIVLDKASNYFDNGINEEKVYEMIGHECKGKYKKFVFLLIGNLQRGNSQIVRMMEEEARVAQMMRMEMIRQRAQKAGVKMYFPMMLMLITVMLIIMLPAYMGFVN